MKNFEIEFEYTVREGASVILPAETEDDADYLAREYVRDTYSDAQNIEIVSVKEIASN